MNICWFNHRCIKHPYSGGSEEHLHQISKRLVERGNDVTVFCEAYPGLPEIESIDNVTYSRGGNRFTVHLRALWTTMSSQFDIYVDDIAHAVPWGSSLLRKNVIAIVHHIHGDVLYSETGPILGRILRFAESLIPYIYKNKRFIVVSQSTKTNLTDLGVKPENITVVHNGVEHTVTQIKKADNPQLIYFGRYKKYKNIDKILSIFKKVHSKYPETSLILAGKGTNHSVLTSNIASLNLKDAVQQIGSVSEQEKADLLASSWVNLVSSSVEGWSITTIEAARHGTPTIAFNVDGLRDSIKHNQTGILVPYCDEEQYLAELTSLIDDPDRLIELSIHAAVHASSYTWDIAFEQFNELLDKEVNR